MADVMAKLAEALRDLLKARNIAARQCARTFAEAALAAYEAAQAEPVAWGMEDKETGLILDVICPATHDELEGDYTVPLYAAPVAQQAKPPAEVWEAAGKTGRMLFATEPEARAWVSQFPASVAGGLQVYPVTVYRYQMAGQGYDPQDLIEAREMLSEIGLLCREQRRFVGSYAEIVRQAFEALAQQATPAQAQQAEPRKPLTREQIAKGRLSMRGYEADDLPDSWAFGEGVRFAEAHHKIKEHP